MSLSEHYQQIEIENLRFGLADAIAYLRLMPRVPMTSAKIVELEKALSQTKATGAIKECPEWKIERFHPGGKALRIRVVDGVIRFHTEKALPEGATVPYELTVAELDTLIDVLVACRHKRIGGA